MLTCGRHERGSIVQETAGEHWSLRPDESEHVVAVRKKSTRRLQTLEVRVRVVRVPFAVVADREEPDHAGFSVVPGRPTPPADVQRERHDLGEKRLNRFLSSRSHLGAALAESRDDFVGAGELVDCPTDTLGREREILGEAPPSDARDELACASLHSRQA